VRIHSAVVGALLLAATATAADPSMPHLRRQGTAIQLVVDGKPFLVRGGELGNSTASNPVFLEPFWPKFAELNMNTVLAPVYWELVEPEEGRFDFSTLDRLVADARRNGMRLVLLWFGSWKNSMSCYAPAWVKRDPQRFPRATDLDGTRQEILSPFSAENRDADARAFAALQRRLRQTDEASRTVLMVQSASRRSASSRSASRPRSTSRRATTSWRSSSPCSSSCRARAGRRDCCRRGRSSGSPSRCASEAGSWRPRSSGAHRRPWPTA